MIDHACDCGVETTWDRFEALQPMCGFGQLGLCCTICNLGPCRIDPFGPEDQSGVCGATAATIAARNLARKASAGSACHSDHGRHMAHAMLLMAEGEAPAYTVRDRLLSQSFHSFFWNTGTLCTGLILLAAAASLKSGSFTVGDFAVFVIYVGVLAEVVAVTGGQGAPETSMARRRALHTCGTGL